VVGDRIIAMKKLTTLDNGLRIVTHHMASVKSVSFGVFNNAGSRDETEDINGTAHFLEHMAFKGTKTRSAEEITQTIAALFFQEECSPLNQILQDEKELSILLLHHL
tara:strand:+ start:17 stop:337 length:321 start_codon:yes stop_codon:yes gene_type:complete